MCTCPRNAGASLEDLVEIAAVIEDLVFQAHSSRGTSTKSISNCSAGTPGVLAKWRVALEHIGSPCEGIQALAIDTNFVSKLLCLRHLLMHCGKGQLAFQLSCFLCPPPQFALLLGSLKAGCSITYIWKQLPSDLQPKQPKETNALQDPSMFWRRFASMILMLA